MIEIDSIGDSGKITRACIILFLGVIVLFGAAFTFLKYPDTVTAKDLSIRNGQVSFGIETGDFIKIEPGDKIAIRCRRWSTDEQACVGKVEKNGQGYRVTSTIIGHDSLIRLTPAGNDNCTIHCQPKNLIRLLLFNKVNHAK